MPYKFSNLLPNVFYSSIGAEDFCNAKPNNSADSFFFICKATDI